MLTNPLTRQVLNANPEGHNQYFNPDGTVRPTASGKMTRFRKLLSKLNSSSLKAGRNLYGEIDNGLDRSPDPMAIRRIGLVDRLNEGRNNMGQKDTISTWEYPFKPSTGEGFDVSDTPTSRAFKKHHDDDGNLYTYVGEDDSLNIVVPKKRGVKEYDFTTGEKRFVKRIDRR